MKKFLQLIFLCVTLNVHAQWQQCNGPFDGPVYFISKIDSTFYTGTKDRGVFVSTDSCGSWTQTNNGLSVGASVSDVYSITTNASGIFLGTNSGVYFSADGTNWIGTNNSPPGPNVLSLATSGTILFAGTNTGLFRSLDNGNSWVASGSGIPASYVSALTTAQFGIFASTGNGLFRSLNNGLNWSAVVGVPSNSPVSVNDSTLYTGGFGTVYRSLNGGANWTANGSGLPAVTITATAWCNGYLFAGDNLGDLYSSNDNGISWSLVNFDFQSQKIYSLYVNDSYVYVTTDNGVFVSTDNGNTWIPVSQNMSRSVNQSITMSGAHIFSNVDYKGVYHSSNQGDSWELFNSGLPYYLNNFVPVYSVNRLEVFGKKILALSNCDLYITGDSIAAWVLSNNGLPNCVNSVTPNGSSLYAVANGGLYVSADTANSWSLINPSVPFTKVEFFGTVMYGINVGGLGVYKSIDGGISWQNIGASLSFNGVYDIDINDQGVIFVSGHKLNYGPVYRSSDGGTTWTDIITGSVFPFCVNIVRTMLIKGTDIYIGGEAVYISHDNGNSWSYDGVQTPVQCWELVTDLVANDSQIYASTIDFGVWKGRLSEGIALSLNNEQTEAIELSVFPNPYSGNVQISFSLSKPAAVLIEIFNSLGQKVERKESDNQSPGNYKYEFSALQRGLPSGIYFVKVVVNGHSVVKKMVELEAK